MGEAPEPKKGDLMVVSIDVTTGKIVSVKGVEKGKVNDMKAALELHGFPAYEIDSYDDVRQSLSKVTESPILLVHTHSSPGCEWVLQDGWWRKVCN